MHSLKRRLFVFALTIISSTAFASESFKGYLTLDDGHQVYVDYVAPQSKQPTVVLVNGLVYDLKRWNPYVAELEKSGAGILRYYFRGQLKTLKQEVRKKDTPEFFATGLSYQDLAKELADVLSALEINRKVTVVGLSYGAAIAAEFAQSYSDQVDNLILMAPLVVSLDNYDPAGAWIRWNLELIRGSWPVWGPVAYEYYYNLIYRSYLINDRLSPDRIPSEMRDIEDQYKESIFHQVRAVRDFDLREYDFKKVPRVHLYLASEEDAPALEDQFNSWDAWRKSSRASLVYFKDAYHAIPDAAPKAAAQLTLKTLRRSAVVQGGRVYTVGVKEEMIEFKNAKALKESL